MCPSLKSVLPATPATGFSEITNYNLESEDVLPGDDTDLVASILTGADGLGEKKFVTTEGNSHLIEPFMDSRHYQSSSDHWPKRSSRLLYTCVKRFSFSSPICLRNTSRTN